MRKQIFSFCYSLGVIQTLAHILPSPAAILKAPWIVSFFSERFCISLKNKVRNKRRALYPENGSKSQYNPSSISQLSVAPGKKTGVALYSPITCKQNSYNNSKWIRTSGCRINITLYFFFASTFHYAERKEEESFIS